MAAPSDRPVAPVDALDEAVELRLRHLDAMPLPDGRRNLRVFPALLHHPDRGDARVEPLRDLDQPAAPPPGLSPTASPTMAPRAAPFSLSPPAFACGGGVFTTTAGSIPVLDFAQA